MSVDVETRIKTDEQITQTSADPGWNQATRILFRFAFAYLVLYNLPFPLSLIPYVEVIAQPYNTLWNALVPWVGSHIFQVQISILPNGSGDTTYNYVQVFCFLVLAVLATIIWTVLDRNRKNYERLHEWLRVYIRFSLAATMIVYGAVKVIKSQFPDPPLDRLLQPYGESSPMGLLWTMMGASTSYNIFTGAAEMLGGLLLTTRRTTLLGALVCMGSMANVAMLNFSYDVPVKLYSLHLLAMAIFLALPDCKRLANMFILNRAVEPFDSRPLFKRQWLNRSAFILRTLFIVGFTSYWLYIAYDGVKSYGSLAPKSPLYGIWNVDEFEIDGQIRPPLVTDDLRWRRVVFDTPGRMAIQLMDEMRRRYTLKLDPDKKTLDIGSRDDPAWKASFSYEQPEPQLLTLAGTLGDKTIRARLRRIETPQFLLTNRGFHWINEFPFNR